MSGVTQTFSGDAAQALLGWWQLAGVEDALGEDGGSWLAVEAPVARAVSAPAVANAPVAETLPDTLDAFVDWLATTDTIPEAAWPDARILPDRTVGARLMVICDMPDREDHAAGTLLSGAAGTLFDNMLAAIGLKRAEVSLCALALARPPGGGMTAIDGERLVRRMQRHIALAQPKQLLLLGDKTARALLQADDRPGSDGLRALKHETGTVAGVATHHPRLLLRHAAAKAGCWRDLQTLIRGFHP